MRISYIKSLITIILRYISLIMLIPCVIALIYKEYSSIIPFIISSIVALLFSTLTFSKFERDKLNDLKKSEALCIVTLCWVLFGLLGSIPYLFYKVNFINALFESVSGITTTGATIFTDFSLYPKSIFFWRSFSQWLGGMGIIVLFVAILPQFAIAGKEMFFAETPTPTKDKITPRVRHTASALWLIYILLTFLEIICLKFAGMPLFDSICNSLSTISAGGFSPNQESIMGYKNNSIIWIVSIFIFLSGVNFALQYKTMFLQNFKAIFKSEEFKIYTAIILTITALISTLLVLNNNYSILLALKHSFFQSVSIITTTGFVSCDFEQWDIRTKIILSLLMFTGGCAGSAAGGVKLIRIIFIFKYLKNEIAKILHPNAFLPIKIDNHIVPKEIINQMIGFVIFYFLIFGISSVITSIIEANITVGITGSIASLGNTGPGFGNINPLSNFSSLHSITKIIFIFNMIIGRLELIPFLVMLHPDFWIIKEK